MTWSGLSYYKQTQEAKVVDAWLQIIPLYDTNPSPFQQ